MKNVILLVLLAQFIAIVGVIFRSFTKDSKSIKNTNDFSDIDSHSYCHYCGRFYEDE